MRIDKIYFDMDGVLADFGRGVRELLHMKFYSQDEKRPNSYYDLLFKEIQEYKSFYQDLIPIPQGMDLFNFLYNKLGKDHVEILTAIPNPKRNILNAAQNKIDWCRKYLPDVVVNIALRKEKINFVKSKSSILIDDYTKNIDSWNKMGGTGILFTPEKDMKSAILEILSL